MTVRCTVMVKTWKMNYLFNELLFMLQFMSRHTERLQPKQKHRSVICIYLCVHFRLKWKYKAEQKSNIAFVFVCITPMLENLTILWAIIVWFWLSSRMSQYKDKLETKFANRSDQPNLDRLKKWLNVMIETGHERMLQTTGKQRMRYLDFTMDNARRNKKTSFPICHLNWLHLQIGLEFYVDFSIPDWWR